MGYVVRSKRFSTIANPIYESMQDASPQVILEISITFTLGIMIIVIACTLRVQRLPLPIVVPVHSS